MDLLTQPLPVTHVLEALAGAGEGLWGKERLVEGLMLAQRAAGEVEPRLVVFAPCGLVPVMRGHGFEVEILEDRHRRLPTRSFPALVRVLRRWPRAVVHTHGYKANLIGRLARTTGSPMRALVASCHAWFDESAFTRFYNETDRRTAFLSDLTTVADAGMLERFLRRDRARVRYVANGIPDRPPADSATRARARTHYDFPPDALVAGFLARTDASKGIPEVLDAARRSAGERLVWAIAGTGRLADAIVAANLPNVRYVGYTTDSDLYRAAIDLYVQASHVEGLSLSLLEAMRAGLPIVATSAGSTGDAVRDGLEGRLVAPGDAGALLAAVRALQADPAGAARLGLAARARFLACFQVERQERTFFEIYRSCAR